MKCNLRQICFWCLQKFQIVGVNQHRMVMSRFFLFKKYLYRIQSRKHGKSSLLCQCWEHHGIKTRRVYFNSVESEHFEHGLFPRKRIHRGTVVCRLGTTGTSSSKLRKALPVLCSYSECFEDTGEHVLSRGFHEGKVRAPIS